MSNISMVYFPFSRCSMDDAQGALARSLAVTRTGDWSVSVASASGLTLQIFLVGGDQVVAEGKSIAASTPHAAAMSQCNARFEIVIEDLATTLDETNTLIEAQMTLQELTGGLLYNTWTGKLTSS